MTGVITPCITDQQAAFHILGFAERALAEGNVLRAVEIFRDVLVIDPANDLARRGLDALSGTSGPPAEPACSAPPQTLP